MTSKEKRQGRRATRERLLLTDRHATSFVVGSRGTSSTEWLLTDDGTSALIVDVEPVRK